MSPKNLGQYSRFSEASFTHGSAQTGFATAVTPICILQGTKKFNQDVLARK